MPKGSNPNSRKNLKRGDLTPEEIAERERKRQITINSPEYKAKQQAKKHMADALKEIMNSKIDLEVLSALGVSTENIQILSALRGRTMSMQEAMLTGIAIKAVNEQDVRSAEFVRDTMGEKAPEKVETSVTIEDYVKSHKPKL